MFIQHNYYKEAVDLQALVLTSKYLIFAKFSGRQVPNFSRNLFLHKIKANFSVSLFLFCPTKSNVIITHILKKKMKDILTLSYYLLAILYKKLEMACVYFISKFNNQI